MTKIIGALFAVIGVGMLATCFWQAAATRRFLEAATEAQGMVVSMTAHTSRSNNRTSTTYTPVVRFTTADGRDTRFQSGFSSSPPAYHNGDAVTVLYDPADPGHAEIKGFWTLWFGVVIAGILGVVFSTVGLLVLKSRPVENRTPARTAYQGFAPNR